MSKKGPLQKERVTVRLTPNQQLVLKELSQACHCSQSMIIRTIIGSFLKEHEEVLERIITGEQEVPFNEFEN